MFWGRLYKKRAGSRPKTALKKSYRSYFRRAQIRWVIWRSSIVSNGTAIWNRCDCDFAIWTSKMRLLQLHVLDLSGNIGLTTKFLDNKISTFNLLLSWRFPRKTAFWTIFLSVLKAPPPPPSRSEVFLFLLSSRRLWQNLLLNWRAFSIIAGAILKEEKSLLLWGRGDLRGILRDDLGEGDCESKIAARQWRVNFCREIFTCLSAPSGYK